MKQSLAEMKARERELHLALATCSGVLLAIRDEVRWTVAQKRGIEQALAMAEKAMSGTSTKERR